jgi:hypothetical protein
MVIRGESTFRFETMVFKLANCVSNASQLQFIVACLLRTYLERLGADLGAFAAASKVGRSVRQPCGRAGCCKHALRSGCAILLKRIPR